MPEHDGIGGSAEPDAVERIVFACLEADYLDRIVRAECDANPETAASALRVMRRLRAVGWLTSAVYERASRRLTTVPGAAVDRTREHS